MHYVQLILAVLKTVGAFAAWLRERQLISETEQRVIAEAYAAHAKSLEVANAAREDQRKRNDAVSRTDSLPDDGFRRD